jgi:hypothetical protein
MDVHVVHGVVGAVTGAVTFNGRTTVPLPHQVGVPPPVAVGRLERPADTALETAVAAGGEAAVVCQVLVGLGGVGKTQLAGNLAHRWWRERRVDLLVWVTATSRIEVVTRYAEAAVGLTGFEDADPGYGAQRLLAWLSSTRLRWLIVLDDLTDPTDMQGLWPPITATGRTVVTTRRLDAALLDGRTLIDVGLFTPEEAVDYLNGKLGDRPDRLDEAAELAEDLGRLPLALAQAAAYIADLGLTCAGYRRRLHQRSLTALRPRTLPDDQRTPVALTWNLSIKLADADTGSIAGMLLQLAALLDPNGIPHRLFTTTAVTRYCSARTGQPVTGDDTHDALRALHRLSLVAGTDPADTDRGLVRMHALLQRVVRENTPAQHEHPLAVAAADAINELWPGHEPDARTAHPLRANATTLHHHTGRHLWAADAGHPVLFHTGNSLGQTGLVAAARDYFHHLHLTAVQHLGADHPGTFTTRYGFAHWRGEAGDAAGAAAAFEQLLTDRLRVLGPDHSDTLDTRSTLAQWYGRAGDAAGAAAAYEQLLVDRRRMLGPMHPDTLDTRHNLIWWRGEADGDPSAAVSAYEHLLPDQLRVLGPDHFNTLATRANLAVYRRLAGDPAGALVELEALVVDQVRVLGPDHPRTLLTRSFLADCLRDTGDPDGAATALERLLTDQVRVLGEDHPYSQTTHRSLAIWRSEAGDFVGGAEMLANLLSHQVRVLGPDHRDSLDTRRILAHWRGEAGDPASAATASEEVLVDCLRALGPDDPDTLIARNNLAYWRGRAGDPAGAVTAFEELLVDCLQVFGPDHRQTLAVRNNLARWTGDAGDPAGAVTALEELLDDCVRVLGPDHPDTIFTRNRLVHFRQAAAAS